MAWEMVDTSTADRTMWGLCVRSVNLSTAGYLAAGSWMLEPPSLSTQCSLEHVLAAMACSQHLHSGDSDCVAAV